ncbi:MAG: methylated-DNA--[protein]-cysteine S-methyltransferase [Marinomonas sp.]
MERKTLQKPMAYCDEVYYQVRSTSLGFCLMAATKEGVCAVSLGEESSALIVELTGQFIKTTLVDIDELSNDKETAIWCVWFDMVIEQIESSNNEISDLPLDIQGTDFQQLVWRALFAIPAGEIRTYSDIAAILDKPNAVRAVATACAANKIAVLIPCHRVVRKGGSLAGYRWGLARKKVLLDREKHLKIH